MIFKQKKQRLSKAKHAKPGDILICSAQLNGTFATSGSRHITTVKYPVVNDEIRKDGIVITTNGTQRVRV